MYIYKHKNTRNANKVFVFTFNDGATSACREKFIFVYEL